MPNHSILLHIEPQINQQIVIRFLLCESGNMNIRTKEKEPDHTSLYSLVVQTVVQMKTALLGDM